MKIIKNNKGISLISVVITIILMIIILSSIIFSNSRSKEIKEAMAINRDIDELNKKIEIYYFENSTLPIDEKNRKFVYYETSGEEQISYYRLKIALLSNLSLNNNEIIDEDAINLDPNADIQWYVINPQTHLIYFVNNDDGEIKPVELNYSRNYSNIVSDAKFFVDFSAGPLSPTQPIITDTTVTPQVDVKENNEIYSDAFTGNNKNPTETTGSGQYENLVDYIGYTYDGNLANTGPILTYHNDGIYNYFNTTTDELEHNSNTNAWYDIAGNSYSTQISNYTWGSDYLEFNSDFQMQAIDESMFSDYTLEITLSYGNYSATLAKVKSGEDVIYYSNGSVISDQVLEALPDIAGILDNLISDTNSTVTIKTGMKIHSFRIYSDDLSANQILNNYNVDKQRFTN